MACKNCKHYDENERWGGKGYCSWYGSYYYEDDNCSHFSKKDSGGGCFLTTACCEYKNKADDCYELTMMRKLRDEYIIGTLGRKDLVDDYYAYAPGIVEKIRNADNSAELFEKIYSDIAECVELAENNKNDLAFEKYLKMFECLKNM